MNIRTANLSDLPAITAVEASCLPPSEAAPEIEFAARLRVYAEHFWLLEDNGSLVAFIDGMVTDVPAIRDEMFKNAGLHNVNGGWQAIFGVNTIPEYRRKGCAALLMGRVIADARAQARQGCILTCKKPLINYYEKFGFINEGISQSVHGGAIWYDMRLTF